MGELETGMDRPHPFRVSDADRTDSQRGRVEGHEPPFRIVEFVPLELARLCHGHARDAADQQKTSEESSHDFRRVLRAAANATER